MKCTGSDLGVVRSVGCEHNINRFIVHKKAARLVLLVCPNKNESPNISNDCDDVVLFLSDIKS